MTTPLRILVADDSRVTRESVVQSLAGLKGASVHTAENGAVALKMVCRGGYDLLICDLEMPVMNGLQLLRMLRAQFFSSSELPVIMITQFGDAEQKVRAFADGANDYVTKPLDPQELIARAHAQIELRRLHGENLANQALSLHTQKLAAVAQLSAALAHDLNTPAQYLSDNLSFLTHAFKQLLADEYMKPEDEAFLRQEIPRSLGDMQEGVQRIATIVQTIREFAEADTRSSSTLDVRKTIESVVDLLRGRWLGVVELSTSHDPSVRSLRCGAADMKHALWQLIGKAIDEAACHGCERKREVSIESYRDATHICIRVRHERTPPDPLLSVPPIDENVLRLTRAVMKRHLGELTHEVGTDGWTTALISLPA
jgi:DNA-binding response OmpR family regulator